MCWGDFVRRGHSDPYENAHPLLVLERYADRLDARWWPVPFAGPVYDCMSGALVWYDEKPLRSPFSLHSALRMLWNYRTGLMIGEHRPETEPAWELGRRLFPRWVGFHPGRRRATRQRIVRYRAGEIALIRFLVEVERQSASEPGVGGP